MNLTDRARDVRKSAEQSSRRTRRSLAGAPRGAGWVGTTLIAAITAAAGAVAAFLLDPARGRARRARLVDQGGATVRRLAHQAGHAVQAARSTASGRLAAVTHPESDGDDLLDDVTLTSKVETKLFRDQSVPKGSININVERGIVVLRGEVPDQDMRDRLAAEAASIGGVWSVHNLLHLPGEPAEEEPVAVRG
ncbi:MAG TPA: BON domain-containing protein [Candidatus Limnocylindrales bacterium]|nr:BON domain-containing protein [Candidatus Limnocylindrales bacterium]